MSATEKTLSPRPGEPLNISAETSTRNVAGRLMVLLANTLIVAGGVVISLVPGTALGPAVFAMFLAGHLIWLVYAAGRGDGHLIALNAAMSLLDFYAISIRL